MTEHFAQPHAPRTTRPTFMLDPAVIPHPSPASPPRAGEAVTMVEPERPDEPRADDLGSLIHHERRRLRLSLHDVAQRAGCSRSYLSQIENGRVGPPGDELLTRLEHALSLAPGLLLAPARSLRDRRARSVLTALRADVIRLQATLIRVRACIADNSAAAPLIDQALNEQAQSDPTLNDHTLNCDALTREPSRARQDAPGNATVGPSATRCPKR